MRCPACGRTVTDVYEARPVARGSTGANQWGVFRTGAPKVQPPSMAVAQPCGCRWSAALTRVLWTDNPDRAR